jgi:translin
MTLDLGAIQESIRKRFDAKSAGREKSLANSRTVIRHCANAIRAVHRKEWDTALELTAQAETTLREAEAALQDFPEIFFAGFLHDAQVEYVEARVTYAIVRGEPFPTPEDLSMRDAPYLNGLADTVGELRRHILDLMRHRELERCEQLLDAMDDIYFVLTSMDYPDAITSGLRRRTDVARSLIERTRGEYTVSLIQEGLQSALREHGKKLEG